MPRSAEANNAYYNRRDKQARDRGFNSYGEERRFKESHRETLDEVGQSQLYREMYETDYHRMNPEQLLAFSREILEPYSEWEGSDLYATGGARHGAVTYFIEYEGMDEEQAIAEMRLLYGSSE